MHRITSATFVALVFLGNPIHAGELPAATAKADLPTMAFDSGSANLVPGDKNDLLDIFVYAGPTGRIERVSVASDGTGANGPSLLPSITPDGRYVSFASEATNLVPGDKNDKVDIFVYDRQTHKIERVSVAADGTETNQNSWRNSISPDGRYVAFESYATNLVPGGRVPADIYVHDRQTHTTERGSVSSDGAAGDGYSFHPSISADGRFVAFKSFATNLAPGGSGDKTYVHDRQTHKTEVFGVASAYPVPEPAISGDGRYVAYQSNPGWKPHDSYNQDSPGYNCWQIYVHDRQTSRDELLTFSVDKTLGNGPSQGATISADGRYLAFRSAAGNLVPGDTNKKTDAFVHDRQTHRTELVSVNPDGTQNSDHVDQVSISADGRYVAFVIYGNPKTFVRDRKTGQTVLVSSRGGHPSIAAGGK